MRFLPRSILILALAAVTVLAAQAAFAASAIAPGFDADAFRKNFVAGLASHPNAPALTSADVHVDAAEKAASFGNMDIYVIKGELAPAGAQGQPFVMFVSADGKFYVSDIVDLSAGKSILKDARERVNSADLKGYGHTVFKGTGKPVVVFVSDPFCPYCRQAFTYMMNKGAAYSDFRLAHFPLPSHTGADIACALMVWAAEKDPRHLADFVRFAYTDLPQPKIADKSEQNLEKAWVEVAGSFLKRFPQLSALGKDGKAIVSALNGSPYAKAVSADIAKAAGMDINGTPIIFVGDEKVVGFDPQRLDSLLK
ncbi:MAG: DsbA family protein [Humidesulfovibrio sp.]|nr:DsbA family protein [Humidesulfovibrio sp.]